MQKKRRVSPFHQFPRIVGPSNWSPEEQQFVEWINRCFEDVYRRYGRLRLDDLSESTREYLGQFATEQALAQLSGIVEALKAEVASANLINSLPVGTWLPTSVGAPLGGKWAYPEGQVLDAGRYPEAYAVFGGRLPDVRGRVLVAVDSGQSAFAQVHKAAGEVEHVLTPQEIPSHTHGIPALSGSATGGSHSHKLSLGLTQVGEAAEGQGVEVYAPAGSAAAEKTIDGGGHTHAVTTAAALSGGAGGQQAHGNLQPYLTVRYMVKVLP